MNRLQKRQLVRTLDRYSRRLENKYAPLFRKELDKQVNAFIEAAERVNIFPAALLIINSVVREDGIRQVMEQLYIQEGAKAVRFFQDQLQQTYGGEIKSASRDYQRKDLSFIGDWLSSIRGFFNTVGFTEVRRVTETTRNWLRAQVSKGMEDNLTTPQIRDMITDNGINRSRANVIARTEVMTVLNNSNLVAADSSGLDMYKEWVATMDNRTRPTHRHLDGETVDMAARFSNGGRYPADPELPAQQRIQCRCVNIYLPKRTESGELILRN